MSEPSLQDRYAPNSICFGCGPANDQGLRIKSRVEGDEVVCDWKPEPHHHAFEGILNGGITGAILDCHSNWAAVHAMMVRDKTETPPPTVTAEFAIKMLRPIPMGGTLHLRARVVGLKGHTAVVESTLEAEGRVRTTFRGTFVAVKEGHPAYSRWR
ncbi:MAG: PaaI family thioesterase [Nitrososphaerales archaeon]|jgi:acyl-coenzyme A thioesterase PaaI-like protein